MKTYELVLTGKHRKSTQYGDNIPDRKHSVRVLSSRSTIFRCFPIGSVTFPASFRLVAVKFVSTQANICFYSFLYKMSLKKKYENDYIKRCFHVSNKEY